MKSDFVKWFNKEVNAVRAEVVISREVAPNGVEHIFVSEGDDQLFDFWHNPSRKKAQENPKHTGGKKPYLMLMLEKIEALRKQKVKGIEEVIGFAVCLGGNIEWNTGRLIHKRSKKPLQYKDLLERYSGGRYGLDKILKAMQEHELLFHTSDGYCIAPSLLKRGKIKDQASLSTPPGNAP